MTNSISDIYLVQLRFARGVTYVASRPSHLAVLALQQSYDATSVVIHIFAVRSVKLFKQPLSPRYGVRASSQRGPCPPPEPKITFPKLRMSQYLIFVQPVLGIPSNIIFQSKSLKHYQIELPTRED